ncbi:alpha/beta hydrolase, partial [uncultured Clostridium sp.]
GRGMLIFICIVVFLISIIIGIVSKLAIQPSWAKKYSVKWSDDLGTLYKDISYDDGEANKFDLYLPRDNSKESYGLVVYLHAGGFTQGDKSEDVEMLSWLCSKGYVAAGINYTLKNETNNKSVLSQSNEIKDAIPKVIEVAEKYGYHINEMGIAGGSAGHCLAMIYAYRDASSSKVPVKLLFGAVGPSSFYAEDWDVYGFDRDTEEAREGAANLLGVMGGVKLTKEMIEDGSYIEKLKPVSAVMWVNENAVPSVVAYGKYDKVQPFKGSQRLLEAYKNYNVDYKYFEASHSGHGLQNDNKVFKEYMEAVEEYLDKYMPVEK